MFKYKIYHMIPFFKYLLCICYIKPCIRLTVISAFATKARCKAPKILQKVLIEVARAGNPHDPHSGPIKFTDSGYSHRMAQTTNLS